MSDYQQTAEAGDHCDHASLDHLGSYQMLAHAGAPSRQEPGIVLVRLLSHPSPSTPSISRLAVSWETRRKDRSNNHGCGSGAPTSMIPSFFI